MSKVAVATPQPTARSVDWGDLETGFNPGTPDEALYLIRGPLGTFKTTFACGCPKSILLDFDPRQGGKYVVGGRAERAQINSVDKLNDVVKRLKDDSKTNGANRRFNMVIVDPSSIFYSYCTELTKKKFNLTEIDGFDYGKVARLLRNWLFELTDLGYCWTVVDQTVRRFSLQKGGGESIVTEALLNASSTKFLEGDCHHILTTAMKPYVANVPATPGKPAHTVQRFKRVLETKPALTKSNLAHPKSRLWLPAEIEFPDDLNTSAKMWDHFTVVCAQAAETMKAAIAS